MAKLKKKSEPQRQQCNHCAEYFNSRTCTGAAHLASCRIYNGYKNYETWNVALWIDNDRSSHEYWRGVAKLVRRDYPLPLIPGTADKVRGILAHRLQDEIKESLPDLGASMAADLLGSAMCEVDWFEIAENILSE